jgi:predicted  nucleic acid-binding Zn-ribbon protein
LSRRRQSLEDEILEAMITIEDAEFEVDSAQEDLAEIELEWKRHQASLKSEQDELAQRLNVLGEVRRKQLSLVPAGAMKKYDSIAKLHGGLAVVLLRGNRCQGCQLNVSANTIKAVKQGGLVYCENCGRILTQQW